MSMVGGLKSSRFGFLYTLTGSAEAIVNANVPIGVESFLASGTYIPLDKLDPEQRRAQEQELRDLKAL
jgi:hypothetical protein